MTDVPLIIHDETFPEDALSAQDRVDSAKLQTQVASIKDTLNSLIAAVDNFTRDDNTVADQHIRLRMLHPELLASFAANTAWKAKQNVRGVSAQGDIALSGPFAYDGVTFADGDRILVAAQVLSPFGNGIWIVNTGGPWTRATDCDSADEFNFALVNVSSGNLYGGSTWLQNLTVTTVGVSPVKFEAVFTAAPIGAGAGLTKFGTTLFVNVDGVTIEFGSNALRLKDSAVTTAKVANNAITTAKIADEQVTNAKQAPMSAGTIKGNGIGSPSAPQDLSGGQVTALLDVMGFDVGAGGNKGLVPGSAAGDAAAGKFLSPAGWAVPTGSGSGVTIQAFKDPCRAATTANITLSGTQTIDGVACAVTDRVLVLFQTATAENGIYVVSAGAWTRATDADNASEVVPGQLVHVNEGTAFAGTLWRLTGSGLITLGVTALIYKEVGGWCGVEMYRANLGGSYTPAITQTALDLGNFNDTGASLNTINLDLGTVGENRGAPYLTNAAGVVTVGAAGAGRYRVRARVQLAHGTAGATNMGMGLVIGATDQVKFRCAGNASPVDTTTKYFEMDGYVNLVAGDTIKLVWYAGTTNDHIYLGNSAFMLERVSP